MARVYLEELGRSGKSNAKEAHEYRVEQVREALGVFYRGLMGWRIERKERDGQKWWQPTFGLKTGVHAATGLEVEEQVAKARGAALEKGGWRRRLVEVLRVG